MYMKTVKNCDFGTCLRYLSFQNDAWCDSGASRCDSGTSRCDSGTSRCDSGTWRAREWSRSASAGATAWASYSPGMKSSFSLWVEARKCVGFFMVSKIPTLRWAFCNVWEWSHPCTTSGQVLTTTFQTWRGYLTTSTSEWSGSEFETEGWKKAILDIFALSKISRISRTTLVVPGSTAENDKQIKAFLKNLRVALFKCFFVFLGVPGHLSFWWHWIIIFCAVKFGAS